jgi:hypothetical protein
VRVRRHVDRHPFDARLEVRPVIEVEPADEILIRLSVAGVLRHDEAGDGLEQLALTHEWPPPQLGPADVTLRGTRRDAGQVVSAAGNGDGREGSRARGVGLCSSGSSSGIGLCAGVRGGQHGGSEERDYPKRHFTKRHFRHGFNGQTR